MKKVNQILNVIIGSFIGVFIGHSLCVIWSYNTNPEMYTFQSAPWYTSIQVYGIFTIVILAICLLIKLVLNRSNKI